MEARLRPLLPLAATAGLLALAVARPAGAQPVVPGFFVARYATVTGPTSLSFGADGALYAGRQDTGRIQRIPPRGGAAAPYGGSEVPDPDGVLVDLDGSLSGTPGAVVVAGQVSPAEGGQIVAVTATDVETLHAAAGVLSNPNYLARGPDGLLLSDSGARAIFSFFPPDPPVRLIEVPGITPRFLAAERSLGRIYASYADGTIREFDADGNLLGESPGLGTTVPIALATGGAFGTELYALRPDASGTGSELVRVPLPVGGAPEVVVGTGFPTFLGEIEFGPDPNDPDDYALYVASLEGNEVLRVARPGPLDPFVCYKAKPSEDAGIDPTEVALADADGTRKTEVVKARALCAPTLAADPEDGIPTGDAVGDANAYLASYKVDDQDPHQAPGRVCVSNELDAGLELETARSGSGKGNATDRLLVPSSFDPSAKPDPLGETSVDAFACYKASRADGAKPERRSLMVDDVLGSARELDLKKPKHLCLPVAVDETADAIHRADQLLVCYDARPAKGEPTTPAPSGVHVGNALGDDQQLDAKKRATPTKTTRVRHPGRPAPAPEGAGPPARSARLERLVLPARRDHARRPRRRHPALRPARRRDRGALRVRAQGLGRRVPALADDGGERGRLGRGGAVPALHPVRRSRLAAVVAAVLAAGPAAALDLHVARSFDGSTSLHGAFAPNPRPDPAGAVGPGHIVELLSAYYAVYEKRTTTLLEEGSHVDFWTRAGAPEPIDYAFDPRLVYDAASGRWFAAAITFALAGSDSWLALAVSKGADPTEGWDAFHVDVDPTAANWLDYVALGIDAEALYLLTIRQQPTTETPLGLAVVVVPKADLLAETPSLGGATRLLWGFLLPGVGGQLAVNLDGGGPPMPVRTNRVDELRGLEVRGPVTAPTLSPPLAALPVEPLPRPPDAAQPGPKRDLVTLAGLQLGAPALLQNGSLWAVQGVEVDGRAAIRWLELEPGANAVVQSGVIADPELDLYVPSIAVSDARTVVIGFTGSSESVYPSAYAVAGAPVGGKLAFGEPLLVREGVADYEVLDRFDRNSWGDFSTTLVDPSNPASFWTFLQFAVARDVWEISIAELAVPEPGGVLLALAGGLVLAALRRRRPS